MSPNLVYFTGPPAAGKSTLMAALTGGCQRVTRTLPLTHDVLVDAATGSLVGAELGRSVGAYPGTDTLAMNVSPVACKWVHTAGAEVGLLLGEGDRLAHRGFLDAAAGGGFTVTVVHVTAAPSTLDVRCAARGSTQNQAWRVGRATKAAGLADYAAATYRLVRLDADRADPASLAEALRAALPCLGILPVGVAV
jgi:hypothetical protein